MSGSVFLDIRITICLLFQLVSTVGEVYNINGWKVVHTQNREVSILRVLPFIINE